MQSGGNELSIPFPKLIESSTGKLLIPFDPAKPVHQAALDVVAGALGTVLAEMNEAGSPAKGLRRINEASSHFEDRLRELLDAHPDFECGFPLSTTGKIQRSGYPDLRLVHPASGTVIYLDPKLFEESSRESTLRTFYFTNDPDTLKVREDGLHWLLGIAHDGKDGAWTFVSWDVVELARLEVKLKAEFQAGNHTLYAREMILRQGKGQ